MKIEHITKLILKFIGGGIINIPTKFLKWIKVESLDNNNEDDGDNKNNIFSIPASIKPKYLIKNDSGSSEETPELINVEDFTFEIGEFMSVYDKEAIVSLGINENDLDSLTPIQLQDLFSDTDFSNSVKIDNDIVKNNTIFYMLAYSPYPVGEALIMIKLTDTSNGTPNDIYLFKIENDNMFIFIRQDGQPSGNEEE